MVVSLIKGTPICCNLMKPPSTKEAWKSLPVLQKYGPICVEKLPQGLLFYTRLGFWKNFEDSTRKLAAAGEQCAVAPELERPFWVWRVFEVLGFALVCRVLYGSQNMCAGPGRE